MLRSIENMKIIGNYGTFNNPIVIDPETGTEAVAELYFVDTDGNPICTVCQSRGCDFCSCQTESCRNGEYSDFATGYFI